MMFLVVVVGVADFTADAQNHAFSHLSVFFQTFHSGFVVGLAYCASLIRKQKVKRALEFLHRVWLLACLIQLIGVCFPLALFF